MNKDNLDLIKNKIEQLENVKKLGGVTKSKSVMESAMEELKNIDPSHMEQAIDTLVKESGMSKSEIQKILKNIKSH
jgi:regulator of sirC expression with transglutaminase-like and TPR domain